MLILEFNLSSAKAHNICIEVVYVENLRTHVKQMHLRGEDVQVPTEDYEECKKLK